MAVLLAVVAWRAAAGIDRFIFDGRRRYERSLRRRRRLRKLRSAVPVLSRRSA
jgi:hypothetical protein